MPEPLQLYEFQEDVLEQIKTDLTNLGSLLVAAPTGSGKTVMFSEIISRALRAGVRPALLVHRQELVKQSEKAIANQTQTTPGVVWQSRKEWDQQVTILAQDTLSAIDIPPGKKYDLLIIDEAHHTAAPGWIHTIRRIAPRYLLGFSATPFRQDKEALVPAPFAKVIRPITPSWLIKEGILCPAVIESPIITDAIGAPQPINQASNLPTLYHRAIDYALADGRNRIVIYVSQTRTESPRQVMKNTRELLLREGINAGAISQDLSSARRTETLERFNKAPGGAVLLNYLTLTEGTDIPAIDCVIIGRQTQSESTIVQMIGRGLRKYDGKQNCLVLEYTGRPDMSEIIHYWRIDRPREEKQSAEREKAPALNPAQLNDLATSFPRSLSEMDRERARYPWFKPFPNRPLMALELWQASEKQKSREYRYITIEPTKRGPWKISTVRLMTAGAAPLLRQQVQRESPQDAANQVRLEIKRYAGREMERGAAWRLARPSQQQIKTWQSLYRKQNDPEQAPTTAGEVSDDISMRRFQNRIQASMV